MIQVDMPYPLFADRGGNLLSNGYVYIGSQSQNPETAPITVYWSDGSPAAQPLRTLGGYIVRNGSPATITVNSTFSITVKDSEKQLVYYSANGYGTDLVANPDRSVADLAALRDLGAPALNAGEQRAITVLEHTAGSGVGGGQFRWNATSTATDDNGRTINPTGNAGAGRWERIDPVYWLEQFGIFPDGTDQSSKLSTLLTALVALGVRREIRAGPGTFKFNSGQTQRVDLITFRGSRTIFDFSAMSSGTAWAVTGSAAGGNGQYFNACDFLVDIEFLGPGSGSTVDGVVFDTASEAGTSHLTARNVITSAFRYGHTYDRNSYLITWIDCDQLRCVTGIYMPASQTNAGENIRYSGGATFNCTGMAVINANVNSDLYLDNHSLDFNGGIATVAGARVFLNDCHSEATDYASEPIVVSGSGGTFTMRGGELLMDSGSAHTCPAIVNCTVTKAQGGGAFFEGVFEHNLGTTSGLFDSGGGVVKRRNTKQYSNSLNSPRLVSSSTQLLADGGFEAATLVDDVYLSSDTAAITSRTTGTNLTISTSTAQFRSGAQSLKATKAGAATTNAGFQIAVPVRESGQLPGLIGYYRKAGSQTGTVFITIYEASGYRVNASGVPSFGKATQLKQVTVTLTSSDTGWVLFSLDGTTARLSEFATHIVLDVSLVSMNAGDFFLDDLIIETA